MFCVIPLADQRAMITGSGGTVMTTEDGGQTWQIQRLPQVDWMRRSSFVSEQRGWIIGHWLDITHGHSKTSKIFRTENSGTQWQELPMVSGIDQSVYSLTDIAFVDSATGFLVANPSSSNPQEQSPYSGLVYKTHDGGAHWTKFEVGIERQFNQLVFLDSARGFLLSQPYYSTFDFDSTLLHRTDDGGKTWSTVDGMGYGRIHFVNSLVGWAGNFRTTDGGLTWSNRNFTVPAAVGTLESVCFTDSLTGYAISQGWILKTEDAGDSWIVQKTTDQYLTDIQFFDSRTGYACGYGGVIYRTHDGGATWLRSGDGVTANLEDVDFVDERSGWTVGSNGTVLHTSNGGASWALQNLPAESQAVWVRAVDFIDRQRGWVAGGPYLLKTEDGGTTWQVKLHHPMPDAGGRFRDVHFINEQVGFAVGQESVDGPGILCRTLDGGASWQRTDGGAFPPLDQISFCDATTGWICGRFILLSTTDAGNSWSGQSFPDFLRDIQFADCQHGWMSSFDEGGVFRTSDGGRTWREVPFDDRFIEFFSSFHFLDNERGLASTFLFSNILSTNDGGLHWKYEERLPPARLNAMTLVNDTLGWAVGTNGAILRFRGGYPQFDSTSHPEAAIAGVYPNPFNEKTTIFFRLSQPHEVVIKIYNILGQSLETVVVTNAVQGSNERQWNPKDLPSGPYLIQIHCPEFTKAIKALLIK